MNQGDDFEEISGDLTTGGKKGDVAFGTLTTIHESPLKFGHLMVMPKRHVTQTTMNELTPDESHDLFYLLNEIQEVVENL